MRELVRNEGGAALVAQRVFRGHCDRRRYRVLVKARDAGRDAIRRRKVLEWEAATHLQRIWRGHAAAEAAALLRAELEYARMAGEEKVRAATRIQALQRGIFGRQRAALGASSWRRSGAPSLPPSPSSASIAATVRVARRQCGGSGVAASWRSTRACSSNCGGAG